MIYVFSCFESYPGKYEVFFRHVFTSTQPHKEMGFKCDLAIPVKKLGHITHNQEADAIKKDDKFDFHPKPRLTGPNRNSFLAGFLKPGMGKFKLNPSDQEYICLEYPQSVVAEGCFSWWAIHVSPEWLREATDKTLTKARKMGVCPGYLQDPPGSIYGNWEFSGDLHHLLASYQSIHQPKPDSLQTANKKLGSPDVYLLLGGTLRYPYAIVCVVIVCTEEHRQSEALKDFQPVPHNMEFEQSTQPILALRGLTDENGKVIDYSGKSEPQFYPKLIDTKESYCLLSFAFYFNNQDKHFELNGLSCNEVRHTQCMKAGPRDSGAKAKEGIGYCPNEQAMNWI